MHFSHPKPSGLKACAAGALLLAAWAPALGAATLSVNSRMGEPLDAVLRFLPGELGTAYLERSCFLPATATTGTPTPAGVGVSPGGDGASLLLRTDQPLGELAYAVRLVSDRCADLPRATLELVVLPGAAESSAGDAKLTLAPAMRQGLADAPGQPRAHPAAPAAGAPAPRALARVASAAAPTAAPRGRENGLKLARSLSGLPGDTRPDHAQFLRDVFAALQADPEEVASTMRQVDRLNALASDAIAALSASPPQVAAAPATVKSPGALPAPMLGGVSFLLAAGSIAWLVKRRRDDRAFDEDAPTVTVPVPVPRTHAAAPARQASGGPHGRDDPRADLNFSARQA